VATIDYSSDGPVARGHSGLWPSATVPIHNSDGSKSSSQYVWLSVMTIGHFYFPEELKKFVEL
jgi:hypothetical protein